MLGLTDEEDLGFAAAVFAAVKESGAKFAEVFVWEDCPRVVQLISLTLAASHASSASGHLLRQSSVSSRCGDARSLKPPVTQIPSTRLERMGASVWKQRTIIGLAAKRQISIYIWRSTSFDASRARVGCSNRRRCW